MVASCQLSNASESAVEPMSTPRPRPHISFDGSLRRRRRDTTCLVGLGQELLVQMVRRELRSQVVVVVADQDDNLRSVRSDLARCLGIELTLYIDRRRASPTTMTTTTSAVPTTRHGGELSSLYLLSRHLLHHHLIHHEHLHLVAGAWVLWRCLRWCAWGEHLHLWTARHHISIQSASRKRID